MYEMDFLVFISNAAFELNDVLELDDDDES
jgi:hypothetical protein